MIRETYRSVSSSFTVQGRTFRFTGMEDATDYVVLSFDSWSGWQWQRFYQWEGQGMSAETPRETVADKVNAIIDGVLENMETIVGPLSDAERSYIRTVLGYEAETVMLRRLRQANYIGHGTDEKEESGE